MIPLHMLSYPYLWQLKFSSGALVLLVDVTTLWVKLFCGKFSRMSMIWKGTRLNKRSNSWKCISEQKPSPEVKRTACWAQKQVCVKPHIWGRVQKKKVCFIEGSQMHVVSVTLNGKGLKQPGLFLELAKLSNWWRRALVSVVTKNLMVTLVELHDHICRLEKPTEGQTSLQHCIDLCFMLVWPNSILSSVKTHEYTLGICKKAPKGPSDCEKYYSLVWWTSIPNIMFEGTQLCSSPAEYHPLSKVCW